MSLQIDHRRGTLLAASGVTILSVDALLVRLADAPAPLPRSPCGGAC